MTENKRFTLSEDKYDETIFNNGMAMGIIDVVEKLNELAEEKKELQVQCNLLREQANEFHRGARENANRVRQLEKENKTLKSALKELKEIGDYQEMRIRELSDETNM